MKDISEIQQLPKHFIGRGEAKGFKFTQIRCADRAFLYEVDTGDGIHYEVFRKRINRRFARVSYPTAKAFGIWAWTYMSLNKAIIKFNEIVND